MKQMWIYLWWHVCQHKTSANICNVLFFLPFAENKTRFFLLIYNFHNFRFIDFIFFLNVLRKNVGIFQLT